MCSFDPLISAIMLLLIFLYKEQQLFKNHEKIIFSKYSTNLKTTISQKIVKNSGLLLFLFDFKNFSFLIHIIDNIIDMSVSSDRNSHQWRCSIIVMCLCQYFGCLFVEYDLFKIYNLIQNLIYKFWSQLLKCLGFSLYPPLIFPLQSL